MHRWRNHPGHGARVRQTRCQRPAGVRRLQVGVRGNGGDHGRSHRHRDLPGGGGPETKDIGRLLLLLINSKDFNLEV